MKITFKLSFLIAIVCLQGCSGCIKNSSGKTRTSPGNSTDLPVPVSTKSRVVNSAKDLPGYWVGGFRSPVELWDQEYPALNISIDEIDGTTVKGHIIIGGKVQLFACAIDNNGSKYNFSVKGNAGGKEVGLYKFSIARSDSALNGNWNTKGDTVFGYRYQLFKRHFEYNPNNKLFHVKYQDDSNTKIVTRKVGKRIDTTKMYATITDDVNKFNASATLLTKDEVANLKKADLLVMRSSILARHGYIFKEQALDMFFNSQSWYMPVKLDVTADLTDIEKKNIDLLARYERNAREYYEEFGR